MYDKRGNGLTKEGKILSGLTFQGGRLVGSWKSSQKKRIN
jgi:hypothetical protein